MKCDGYRLHGFVEPAGYRSGRGKDWLKIKCIRSERFVIVGYEPSAAARGKLVGLHVAGRSGGRLVYAGGAGTDFTDASALALRKRLDGPATDKPAVALERKGVVRTRPELIAEIEFRAWTGDGKLRHASLKGLREGADAADVLALASD